MANKKLTGLVWGALLYGTAASAQIFGGNPARTKWYQIDTDTARIIFTIEQQQQAQRTINVLHDLNRTTAGSIGNGQRKINMLLQNQTTVPNAYVRMAPFRSELFMTPGADNFASGSIRWDDNLSIHEYRHVQQLMNFGTGLTKVFSFFLGEEGQLLANGMTVPDYFFEGDAVFQETLVSSQGRGRMPNFFNENKAIWQANRQYSWMRLRNGSLRSISPNHYPTGYMVTAYGYEKYGADFWKKVTQDAVRFKGIFYPFNNSIKNHTGVSYKQFTQDALNWFKEKSFDKTSSFYTNLNYLTGTQKGNVVSYYNPQFTADNAVVALKKTLSHIPAFVVLHNGKERRIRVKDRAIDDYFSYRNGKIVYSAYNIDARWRWQDYSDLRLLDVNTGQQTKLTRRSKYFSPDISADGNRVLAVHVNPDGSSELHLLNAGSGEPERKLPNTDRYFFTQTRFVDDAWAVSAVRHPNGTMALVKVDLANGATEPLTPFSYNVIGYPSVKNGKVYFSMAQQYADKVFAVGLADKQLTQLTNNDNGVYQPNVSDKGEMVVSVVTADGNRIALLQPGQLQQVPVSESTVTAANDLYVPRALQQSGAKLIESVQEKAYPIKRYRKSFQLFNFHSRRPVMENNTEFGYSFFSENMLNTFSNIFTYTYNRNERSHNGELLFTYGGWLPVLYAGVKGSFNRNFLFSNGTQANFNSATAKVGAYLPLTFVSGRNAQNLTLGGDYNAEQLYYTGIGKDIFGNRSFDYLQLYLGFSSFSQRALQHILPRWGQTLSLNFKKALTFTDSRKLLATGNLYLPGLHRNHNLVVNMAWQNRDTLGDIFSNNFPFSRGYEPLRTRRMYKMGATYHFPLAYPDWGFGNIAFVQRIRANAFFDYTSAYARLNGVLQDIPAKSVGGELYLDGKIWNALPISIGVRYSHLLDRDFLSPGRTGLWEIVLPVGIIPD
jgi:hypothetical protein